MICLPQGAASQGILRTTCISSRGSNSSFLSAVETSARTFQTFRCPSRPRTRYSLSPHIFWRNAGTLYILYTTAYNLSNEHFQTNIRIFSSRRHPLQSTAVKRSACNGAGLSLLRITTSYEYI